MPAGKKTGGRVAGTPNRQTVDIMAKLAKLKCDPIIGMARIAMGDVPCDRCAGSGTAKYVRTDTGGWAFDPEEGSPSTCRVCWGSRKEPVDLKLQADMHKELAQYVAPKRKAVELSGTAGGAIITETTYRWADAPVDKSE